MKKHVILLLAVFCATSAIAKFVVCDQPYSQYNPVIYEDKVYWTDGRLFDKPSQIFFKQLPFGNDVWITNNGSAHEPDIWGDYIVYKQPGSNAGFVYSLSAQKILDNFPNTNTIVDEPRIHNNIVVWSDKRNDTGYAGTPGLDIYGYNLNTSTEFPIFTGLYNSLANQTRPVIFNEIVVWTNWDNSRPGIYNITAKNIITGEVFTVCNAPGSKGSLEIHGNTIVWADNRSSPSGPSSIYGFYIDTRTEFLIASNASRPKIYGDVVVYNRSLPSGGGQIYGYNLKTQSEFLIYEAVKSSPGSANIYGEIVVWSESVFGNSNLYGENIEKVQSEAIGVGQVKTGTTVGNRGIDFTEKGYNDTIDTWYNFTAPSDGDYVIGTLGSDFDTTLAVFDDEYNEIEFNDRYGRYKQSKLTLRGVEGVKYFIRIAGHNGQTGNYRLSVINDGPEPLISDLNSDGNVNAQDLSILASEWLKSNN